MIGSPGFGAAAVAEMSRGCILPFIGLVVALLLAGGLIGYFVAERLL